MSIEVGPDKNIGTSEEASAQTPESGYGFYGCLGSIILLFAVLMFMGDCGCGSTKDGPEHDETMAWVMTQQFIKDQLKAPSTAKFPWTANAVTYLGDGRYRVTAYVDSQDSFGAMIRMNFTATVKYRGDDYWVLEKLLEQP